MTYLWEYGMLAVLQTGTSFGKKASPLLDRACGTVYQLICDRLATLDSLGNICKHTYLGLRSHNALTFDLLCCKLVFTYLQYTQ